MKWIRDTDGKRLSSSIVEMSGRFTILWIKRRCWAARYVMKENELGTLEKGKLADFLVISKDVLTVPVEELAEAIPLMTVVGGKVRMLREDFAKELGRSPLGFQIHYNNQARYRAAEE